MSRRVSPLAGFQVTIIGRFWVTTEDNSTACAIRMSGRDTAEFEVLDRGRTARTQIISQQYAL